MYDAAGRGGKSQGSGSPTRSQARGSSLQPPFLATLPEELWHEIFLHCLPTNEFIRPSCTSAPLLLCQVCRAWRASAIALPDLWASISIGSDFDAVGRFPRVELLKLWLSRSKTRPLSISYGRYPLENRLIKFSVEDEEEEYKVFHILFRHIARWKSLRLCPKGIAKRSLPAIPQPGAPLLQHLCLFLPPSVYREYAFSTPDQTLCDIWRHSTLLDTFSLLADDFFIDEHYVGSSCKSIHIRWSQLTTLKITACRTVTQCLEFLKECPNLMDCAFYSIYSDDDDDDDALSTLYPTTILLPSLRSLFLRYSGPAASEFITDLLLTNTTMPALRQLMLNAVEVFSLDSFAAFIRRSSCHIEDLALYGVIMNDACLLQFLELLSQTLVRLCIQHYDRGSSRMLVKCMSDTVIHQLTRDKTTSPAGVILCPKLESIDLDYRTVKARDGLFSKMVSSRFGMENCGITTLKKVVLRFGDEAAIDGSLDVSALKQLREDGVIRELIIEKIS